jgi:lipopolysaccharide export system permease protein
MKNIVIYKKDEAHSDQLFIAKEANFNNENSVVTLTLNDGSGYTFTKDALKKINYETMKVFKNLNTEAFTYNSIVQYWKKQSLVENKKSKIFFFIFASLIPLLALGIIAAFSIINPRYQKNYAYHILALTTIGLYGLAIVLKTKGTPLMVIGFSSLILILGYYLYKRYVLRFF